MGDFGTMTSGAGSGQPAAPDGDGRDGSSDRTTRRSRGLPRGRAVVGALLVAASAVAVFAAYLDATGEPDTSYLVADRTIEAGTRFADRDEVLAAVTGAPMALVPEVAARAIPVDAVDQLVGWLVVAPLERGDLLTRSAVVADEGHDGAHSMSFSLPRAAAVGGSLRPGQRIDVLATRGSGDSAVTSFIVRGVPVLQVTAQDGGALGGAGEVMLTVALDALEDVQSVGHAVNTASVFVTSSTTGDAAGDTGTPRPYTTGTSAVAEEDGAEGDTAGGDGDEP